MTSRAVVCIGVMLMFLTPEAMLSQAKSAPEDVAASVDPFIGTAGSGNTFPGATAPFGMIQWSPDTIGTGRYEYESNSLRGFSLTHISGAGCLVYEDVPILPWVGALDKDQKLPRELSVGFSHSQEMATAGYYSVKTADGVTTELTTDIRSGVARLTFPERDKRTLIIKASESANVDDKKRAGDTTTVTVQADGTITGEVKSGGFCSSSDNYTLYFVLYVSETPESSGVWTNTLQPGVSTAQGHHAGAYLTFAAGTAPILLKAGISYVSVENAAANLKKEIDAAQFDTVRQRADSRWNEMLSRASVEGGTSEERTIYYTALYHSLLSPNVFSDTNGDYIGFDNKVRRLTRDETQYANYSDWDIYRNTIQLQALLDPLRTGQMLQSLVRDAEQGGSLPKWAVANGASRIMSGDSPAIVISSGFAFGARGFDSDKALAFMLRATKTTGTKPDGLSERPYLDEYLENGYITVATNGGRRNAASITLEYANADFAVSRFAEAHGDHSDATLLLERAQNWRYLLDPESRFIRPRTAAGGFLDVWDPDKSMPRQERDYQLGFEEGSTWQYSWMIPYNYAGVLAAMGGDEVVLPRLKTFFTYVNGKGATFTVGNEPDFCAIYTYLWTSEPWKTAEIVEKVRREAFTTGPSGLPGNDDLGATSGVYVWGVLGLYPEIPGVSGVTIGTPLFRVARMRFGEGKTLEITRKGEGSYVQAVRLNGRDVQSSWLPLSAFRQGANHLSFEMSQTPNMKWAVRPQDRPPSFDGR